MAECPCCGQTLPPDVPLGITLTPGELIIYERVRRAGRYGVPGAILFNHVYADDPHGGPLTERKCLMVRISHLNRKLRPKGWTINAGRSGHGQSSNYVLRRVQS